MAKPSEFRVPAWTMWIVAAFFAGSPSITRRRMLRAEMISWTELEEDFRAYLEDC